MTRPALMAPDDMAEDGLFVTTQTAEDLSAQQNDIDDQLNTIFSEIGGDKDDVSFTLSIWRVIPNKAQMAFLFKCTASELPIMERLRDEYEGGQFLVQVYRNKKRFRKLTVFVEPPKKNPVKEVRSEMADMIKAVSEQQERQFNMLRETMMQMQGKPTTPQPSQLETMGLMMGLLETMKNFAAPPQTAASISPDKMIDILLKGMEIGRDSGGSGGGETNFMDIIKEALKSPLLLSAAQQVTQPSPPVARLPAGQIKSSAPNQPVKQVNPAPTVKPTENKMATIISNNLDKLVEKAENGSDPVLYAEFILDNVPEELIAQYILNDNFISEMTTLNPKVAQYKDWFMELRNHIHGVLTGEGEDGHTDLNESPSDNVTDHPGGDGGDESHP